MSFGPLVSCEALHDLRHDPLLVVFDCRYDLLDKEKGAREYSKGHIPGSYHAHVERDLAGPVGSGSKGRHPLPLEGAFQRFCGNYGIQPGVKVVCYDDQAGQWASRLWWLLRHYGHTDVAVLDGGLTRWKALKLPLGTGHERPRTATKFTGKPGSMPTVQVPDLERSLLLASGKAQEGATTQAFGATRYTLVDVRVPERFEGKVEPMDKRAGHIPGAVNLPVAGAVGPDQRFRPAAELAARFDAVGIRDAGRVACYCGSGVTSTHAVLTMEVAGLGTPALYPGSWSEWSYPEAGRPIETGPQVPAAAVQPVGN